MSKKSRITQANILAEQRYLSKKFLFEVETPQTTTQTSQPQQATTPTSQPPQTTTQTSDQPVDLKTLIDTQQIDLTDTTKNQQVLNSILANKDYTAKIPDINTLKQKVNTAEFLPELSKHIELSFKPERDKIDKQTVKGWEFGIGNDKFHADIVFDRKTGAPEELGVGTHAHIGNKNIGLNMGMKMPHQSHDSHSSVNTGYFNQGGQIKAGVTIPIGNSGGHHKKSHGAML